MSVQTFRASLSRSQGRSGWCIIFRHPIRRTPDGRSALRIRRGLGTANETEAQYLVNEMNELLAREELWNPTSREEASRVYDERIVNAFYHDLVIQDRNSWAIRDQVISLPDKSQGYTRCMTLGTTGAGKTTLVRQLIGTDPLKERFPSTASAKTTVADIEIVLGSESDYESVVTFISREQTRILIEESIAAAALAHIQRKPETDVIRRALEHAEQRFRLSYLLGTLEIVRSAPQSVANSLDDWEETEDPVEPNEDESVELTNTEQVELQTKLRSYLSSTKAVADSCRTSIENDLGVNMDTASRDEREALEDLFEDQLRQEEEFQILIDNILDDVESRFDIVPDGNLTMGSGHWPSHWYFKTSNRSDFIRAVNRFSSNYAPNFGKLLTPLVDGIRVAGPFQPDWIGEKTARLVLLDGEGLGHTPDSAFSLSTRVTRKYDIVDAILLVDNATQPMQAVPMTVLKSVVASGHEEKLVLCFTHFDDVRGDNLPTTTAKKNHVLGSLENALISLGEVVGRGAEDSARRMLERNVVFLAGIDRPLTGIQPTGMMRFSASECLRLTDILEEKILEPEPPEVYPIYDDANLVLAIQRAMQEFNQAWSSRLGLQLRPGYPKEHWARVKALTRRLGELGVDEYDTMRPVAEMLARLTEHINRFLSTPVRWKPKPASDEKMRSAINTVARQVATRLYIFTSTHLFEERVKDWGQAYSRRGTGSTYERARDIESILRTAAPVPGEVSTPEAYVFISEVRSLVRDALAAAGGELSSD